jgi:glycosyltransferase involved in cell wall biosynthesis
MIPWRGVCATYGVHRSLKRKVLPGFYLTSSRWRSVSNPLLRISLTLFAIKSGGNSVFLGRHPQLEPLGTLIRLKMRNLLRARIVVELHEPHHYVPNVDQHIDGYVVISKGLESFLLKAGVDTRRILLAPNAVDLASYEQAHRRERSALRRHLRWPEEHSIICYTGQLGPGRNVETLVQAMQYLEEKVNLLLVGGRNSDDVRRLEEFVASNRLSQRVKLIGQQPTQAVIDFQVAADVLVIPYNSTLAHAKWCSPLKLWEYLASSRPIVAFPIPGLREVLRDDEVVWAKEETAVALAAAIREALTRNPRAFDEIRARVGDWTWVDRAQRVLSFIDTSSR